MAEEEILLPLQIFRSKDIVLVDSGIGSFAQTAIVNYIKENLSDIFNYAAMGKLVLALKEFSLNQVSKAWKSDQAVIMI